MYTRQIEKNLNPKHLKKNNKKNNILEPKHMDTDDQCHKKEHKNKE